MSVRAHLFKGGKDGHVGCCIVDHSRVEAQGTIWQLCSTLRACKVHSNPPLLLHWLLDKGVAICIVDLGSFESTVPLRG